MRKIASVGTLAVALFGAWLKASRIMLREDRDWNQVIVEWIDGSESYHP